MGMLHSKSKEILLQPLNGSRYISLNLYCFYMKFIFITTVDYTITPARLSFFVRVSKISTSSLVISSGRTAQRIQLFLESMNAETTKKENTRQLLPMNMAKRSSNSISMSQWKEEWTSGKQHFIIVLYVHTI